MSALQALDSDDPDHTIQDLQSVLATLTETIPITLQWVPAPVCLAGNETADRHAKAGRELEWIDIPATYKEAKTLLRPMDQPERRLQSTPRTLERKHQSVNFRLHTWHCCLHAAHLKRIGVAETYLCPQVMFSKPAHSMRKGVGKSARATQIWPPNCGERWRIFAGLPSCIITRPEDLTHGLSNAEEEGTVY